MIVAMQAAKEMGYTIVVLASSPVAEKLYRRLGFVTVTPIRVFYPKAATV